MSQWLDLRVETSSGSYPTRFGVDRVYNLGWTIRDEAKQQAHMDEVARAGVRIPNFKYHPIMYAVTPSVMTTESGVLVQRDKTCGEVEFVLLGSPDAYLVTVGSDHTDRMLENHWIPWSKQACANVIAPKAWPMAEVREHWDRLILSCDVLVDGVWQPFQRAELGEFVSPESLWAAVRARVKGTENRGVALFSGTVTSFGETLIYAPSWRLRLEDPVLGRTIEHTYSVTVLQDEFHDPEENMQ